MGSRVKDKRHTNTFTLLRVQELFYKHPRIERSVHTDLNGVNPYGLVYIWKKVMHSEPPEGGSECKT